ncbi:hypothetical protein [Ancylothrix sp. D3o]|uniref:hypothetical protein n=1 Tax=Ancylothrix sp. D3o TaxID=2953691 RepID=UPI0021BBA283|nr:hypothetical protein [Ancylothrix sp. D3o]
MTLVLTNPYAYEKALSRGLELAVSLSESQASLGQRIEGVALNVVFLIDPEALDELVQDLGEQGWLGLSSQRNLQASMLEGYRALAADILQEALKDGSQAGLSVETALKEVPPSIYVDELLNAGTQKLIVCGSSTLAAKLGDRTAKLEWIEDG